MLKKIRKKIEEFLTIKIWNAFIWFMTVNQGWILGVSTPIVAKEKFVALQFLSPYFTAAEWEILDDGHKQLKSIGLLPSPEHLVTHWQLTKKNIHMLNTVTPMDYQEFDTEVKNAQ